MGLPWSARGPTAGEPVPDQAFDAIRHFMTTFRDLTAGEVIGLAGVTAAVVMHVIRVGTGREAATAELTEPWSGGHAGEAAEAGRRVVEERRPVGDYVLELPEQLETHQAE